MSEVFQHEYLCLLVTILTGHSKSRWKIDSVVVFSNTSVSTFNAMDMPYKKSFWNNLVNLCRNIYVMTFLKDITMQNLYHLKTFPTKSILIRVMFQHSIILLFSRYRRMKSRTNVMERVLQLLKFRTRIWKNCHWISSPKEIFWVSIWILP